MTTPVIQQNQSNELQNFVGKRFIYTYENGWQYELYIKNETTIDYRIHSGMVGGRWVKDQEAYIRRIADEVCKISWDEPTGTVVSVAINLAERRLHGIIFFPQWIALDPGKTICFQNEYLDRMRAFRDAGPTYPKMIIDEFAPITFIENVGANNEDIINCAPPELPEGFAARKS